MSMIEKQINDLELLKTHWGEPKNYYLAEEIIDSAIDTIQALSAKLSASNLDNGWISCSERMPEQNGIYLVTYQDDIVGRYVTERHCFDGKFSPMPFYEEHTNRKPIAWQPLPQPYKE